MRVRYCDVKTTYTTANICKACKHIVFMVNNNVSVIQKKKKIVDTVWTASFSNGSHLLVMMVILFKLYTITGACYI